MSAKNISKIIVSLVLSACLINSANAQAPVNITQVYNFLKWISVKDSIRASIYLQGSDTLATHQWVRDNAGGGGGGGLSSVSHDNTMTGNGTVGNPLKVDSSKIQAKWSNDTSKSNIYNALNARLAGVTHDGTMSGLGTTGSPLRVDSSKFVTPYWFNTNLPPMTMRNIGTATGAVGVLSALSDSNNALFKNFYSSDGSFQFTNVGDSLVNATAGNVYKLGGNSFGANAILGTNDNYPLILYQNGVERERLAATTGNRLMGTTSDNGTDKLQVNGSLIAQVIKSSFSRGNAIGSPTTESLASFYRTENGQTWGFDLGTSGDGNTRSLTFAGSNNTGAVNFNFNNAFFFGDVTPNGNLVLRNTSFIRHESAGDLNFMNFGGFGVGGGYSFFSNYSGTGRTSTSTNPIACIDQDGFTKITTAPGSTGVDNYAAALDVQSTFSGFLPPRMTTSQRDSITGIHYYVITTLGCSYTSVPSITISGGGGSGATATPVLSGGTSGCLLAITPQFSGSGYTSVPTVAISGGGGGAATCKIGTIVEGLTIYNLTTHKMQVWNGSSWNDLY